MHKLSHLALWFCAACTIASGGAGCGGTTDDPDAAAAGAKETRSHPLGGGLGLPIGGLPIIDKAPANATVGLGEGVSFSVIAHAPAGSFITGYRWLHKGVQVQVGPASSWAKTSLGATDTGTVSVEVLSTAGNRLVVAWVETVSNVQALGRMALKRYSPASQQWTGTSVLPAETNVTAVRLTTEAAGNALLMFAPFDAQSFEGPLRVLREDVFGAWTDVCSALSRPSGSGEFNPNSQLGFGIATSGVDGVTPVAVFNNGEAVFAVACRSGGWAGLDGSVQGQVASIGQGEVFIALSVAQGEGSGVALAWSKVGIYNNGYRPNTTQVLVENATATAMVASGDPLSLGANEGFSRGRLSIELLAADSPLLGGLLFNEGGLLARVFRFVP